MKKIIPVFLISLFLSSCENDKKEISLTFVFDKPINNSSKYPQYFEEISVPFTSDCNGNSTDILMKPINVCRLDISNKEVETNAWHFKDMGDNTVEFSTLWLKQYYKDSLITPYITQPSVKVAPIENWLNNNKDSIYVFAEDSDATLFKGKQVFNNTKELNAKIKEIACSNVSGRIVVLVNPKSELPPPPHPVITKIDTTKPIVREIKKVIKKRENKGNATARESGFLGKDRTVDEMKTGILTKKELNGNN